MKLNGYQVYIATLVLVVLSTLVWFGKMDQNVLQIVVSLIVGYYFGEFRGLRKEGR